MPDPLLVPTLRELRRQAEALTPPSPTCACGAHPLAAGVQAYTETHDRRSCTHGQRPTVR